MTWQPMDTAPLDGTHVLLYAEDAMIEGRFVGGEWEPVRMSSHGCGCCGGGGVEPTHWMPLPDSP